MSEPTRKTRRPKNKNALLVAKTSLVALSVGLTVGGFGILAGVDPQATAQADVPDAPLSPIIAPSAAPTAAPTTAPARPQARQGRQESRQSQSTSPRAPAATPMPRLGTPPTQVQPQQPQQIQPQQPQQIQPQQPAARPQARTRSSR